MSGDTVICPAWCTNHPPGLPSGTSTGILSGMTEEKIRENRLRRMAQRQGLTLQKSRRRDPRAIDYGTYMLIDASTTGITACGLQSGYGLDLDEVEAALTE
jgi:hypothetical protein